ncbi:olfactory receptor 21 [Bombyx mori]|uniref:Odorant receptor n=1 Tax=Bombyx mori TaxID=7091 RepID=A7E3G4_BOMMO|nr:olfactory receptor 21 [Bombyx mori]DAA05979.1 TPA_exp: odorant receptor 21 [Bombyx mori]
MNKNMNKNHYILKTYCDKIFLVGSGNFWYQKTESRNDKTLLYKIYSCVLFFTYGFMTVLEIMAAMMGDFPEDEKRDSVTFATSHTVVMIKFISIIKNKELLKTLNRKMMMICEAHEEQTLMDEMYRTVKINVVAYCVAVYGSATFYVFEGLRKFYNGSHFVTIVTYYPSNDDDTLAATIVRIATTLVLLMMLLTMIISVDTYTMAYLIMYKYKFITLRHYFKRLRENVDELVAAGKARLAAEKLAQGLVEGIKMHNELLSLSKDIDKAFGTVMALQLCQSSGSAVSLLLQIAVTMYLLLALFLCNAGEITYQASLLSDEIFYCGWHKCNSPVLSTQRNIRDIVLIAILRAQSPLVMKAFKMVVRSTYSVFALFYAQNK